MNEMAKSVMVTVDLHYPVNDDAETVNEIGVSVGRVMGGTCGILYRSFLRQAYGKLKANGQSVITSKQSLEDSIAAVNKYGGAAAGHRTMLDALIPAVAVLQEKLSAGIDPSTAFLLSSEAALAGAESTEHMQAQFPVSNKSYSDARCYIIMLSEVGKSWRKFYEMIEGKISEEESYNQGIRIISEILASVPDPGAMEAAAWYIATALAVNDKLTTALGPCHSSCSCWATDLSP